MRSKSRRVPLVVGTRAGVPSQTGVGVPACARPLYQVYLTQIADNLFTNTGWLAWQDMVGETA
jgi:hypothetical protein